MKLSKGPWQTYKETPADAEISSHQLMIRAGLIHKSGAGLYAHLPFGVRVISKIQKIIREEMEKIDVYEIIMPVVTPGELWKESGRWDKMEGLMLKFQDRGGRDLCLSPTNEEAVVDIFKSQAKSYKQLPMSFYQMNTKFRDEIRPRFGVMRAQEFTMKDAYSFHIDKKSLDETYENIKGAYHRIFERMGLEFFAVEADAGAIGDSESLNHEFQVIAESGEDEIVYCPKNQWAANIEKAKTLRMDTDFDLKQTDIKEVSTPNCTTITEVCDFFKCGQSRSLKSLIYKTIVDNSEKYILFQLLGDDSLNEVKAKNILNVDSLVSATDEEIERLGIPKGYIGPYQLKCEHEIKIIFDESINLEASYIVGALKRDYHLLGFCPSRDLKNIEVADLRLAKSGDVTTFDRLPIEIKRGIEVGHIFQLGDIYTKAMKASVLNEQGKATFPLMGCYGIGVTRIVAAAIEQNHDEKGIIWPQNISPFDVYFAVIGKTKETFDLADEIYFDLKKLGIDVLLDDRKAGAGFKFKDSDLLGLPFRLVLGERDFKIKGELELVCRKTGTKEFILKKDIVKIVKERLDGRS